MFEYLSLIWDFFKWKAGGYCFVVQAQAIESHWDEKNKILLKIINRGSKSATIQEIKLATYGTFLQKFFRFPCHVEFISQKGKMNLPCLLQPGAIWDGEYALNAENENCIKADKLYYKVLISHRDKHYSGMIYFRGRSIFL